MLLLIVVSGVIISLCMGLRQSLGLFMRPMTVDLGISAATFGFSIALQNIVWGLSQPFVGAAADRYGARPVLVVTALVYAAGLLLMGFSSLFPGALQVAGFLAGVGTAGTGFGVLIGTVSRATAPEKRSQTVGLVAAAGSLGTLVMAPLGQHLINGFGWQAALMVFAVIAASMAVLSLAIREPAVSHAGSPQAKLNVGEALREAMAHRGYLFMTLAFFACGFQLVFITTHLPSYLQICGVAPGVGASALALIGLFNTVGTYMFGLLGARYSQKHLLALIYLLRTLFIVIFLLVPVSAGSTLVFAAAMGFLWLGVAPLVTGIIGRMFGLTHFNTLYGVVFLSHQVGSFFGAWMGGVVFDRFGNYNFGWGALIAIGLTAFTLQWLMDERPPREPRRGPQPAAAAA
jgi:predicted MFS family arabinose efflux permease